MSTARNNLAKISLAIEYMENHLTEKMDLESVAQAIHYSKFHLHRMFSDTVGLTIHDYLQRRRLTESAKLLVFSDKPILDVAMLAGYESQQAFTSIFKAMYKQTPNQFRANAVFYPLQLRFELKGEFELLDSENVLWDITFATEDDIPCWMDLVRHIIDGFPHLHEEEHIPTLKMCIQQKRALITKDGCVAVGIMLFSYNTGSIGFFGVHPLYRKNGVTKAMLDKAMPLLLKENEEISITTFREGDKADTGYRKTFKTLGFAEGELLIEFGYPTQKFIIPRSVAGGDQ